jgi:hypothetical protein
MSKRDDVKVASFTIDLDRKRTVAFDMNAFIALEDRFGSVEDAMSILREMFKKKKGALKIIRTFLWAGLQSSILDDEVELTEKQVGALITTSNMSDITHKLSNAISGSLPEEDVPVDEKNVQTPEE